MLIYPNIKMSPILGLQGSGGGLGYLTGGGSASGGWEILSYTDKPGQSQTYTNYTDITGYVPTDPASGGVWQYNNNQSTVSNSWDTSRPWHRFGQMGRFAFQDHTESNSGANTRTSAGDGDGFYSAAYNKTNLTKIALVGDEGTVDLAVPTNSTNHLVYDLVGTSGNTTDADAGTGSYTLISLLQALSAYNRTAASWVGEGGGANNLLFNGPDCRNFTSGGSEGSDATARAQSGYSGLLQSAAGKMRPLGTTPVVSDVSTDTWPNLFCFWGINLDSDHDTQVCAAYYGGTGSTTENPYGGYHAIGRANNMGSLSVQSTFKKADSWRGASPKYTFFSLWGNDWHSNSKQQNISGSGSGDEDDSNNALKNKGRDNIFGSGDIFAGQTFPGVKYPNITNAGVDPNLHMCKKIYLLGFS